MSLVLRKIEDEIKGYNEKLKKVPIKSLDVVRYREGLRVLKRVRDFGNGVVWNIKGE